MKNSFNGIFLNLKLSLNNRTDAITSFLEKDKRIYLLFKLQFA